MSIAGFITKNALRNKRRALLCVMSVAVSLFLLVMLQVVLREMTVPPEDIGAALRVIVRNKISLANLLPARQRQVLEKIPGVEAVTPFTFYGGQFRNEKFMTFAQFALDPATMPALVAEMKTPAHQHEAWVKNMRGCIVGKVTAQKYGMKIGDRLPFTGTIWPCDLELTVMGFYEGTIDDRNVFFHQKYLDEASGSTGQIGTWWVKVRSIDDMPLVVDAINKAFENTSAEVRAETERAFQMSMVSMWGNIKILIGSISTVVVFTLVLVSASTMSMAIRERFRELAVLKALGFQRWELFGFILAESFGLAMAGALIGVGGAWLIFTHTRIASLSLGLASVLFVWTAVRLLTRKQPEWMDGFLALLACLVFGLLGMVLFNFDGISKMTNGFFVTFEVTERIIGLSTMVAAGLGLLATLAPAVAAARMSVVEGLKTLD